MDAMLLSGIEPDPRHSVDYCRDSGDRAVGSDHGGAARECLGVGGGGEPERGEDGGLQRHDRSPLGESGNDFVRDDEWTGGHRTTAPTLAPGASRVRAAHR